MKTNYTLDFTNYVRFEMRGQHELINHKVCWQAHDEYYDCIDKEVRKNNGSIDGIIIE